MHIFVRFYEFLGIQFFISKAGKKVGNVRRSRRAQMRQTDRG
jgi:hypothetical protein